MIYKLKPNRVHRTYLGGKRIDNFCGTSTLETHMPEDWTASVTTAYDADGNSEGVGFTLKGKPLTEIVDEDYKLLVKLLDSDERLVIQAHPTVPFAKKHLNSDFGKTECWYFLDCALDAYVLIGFKEGITRSAWEQAFTAQDIPQLVSMLHKIPVKSGDFIFVEGGVPHAIGAGCFMVELQEPSDLMVVAEKTTPSGRIIPDRRIDMGLSFDKMMDVYDYTPLSFEAAKEKFMPKSRKLSKGVTEILGAAITDKFKMLRCDGNCRADNIGKYAVAICINGSGSINGTKINRGDRLLIKDETTLLFCDNKNFSVIICC